MNRNRIRPSVEDVLTAIDNHRQIDTVGGRPRSMVDISHELACMAGRTPYSGTEAADMVAQNPLRQALDQLVADGVLVCQTGGQWDDMGKYWSGQNRKGRYWARPDQVAAWQAEGERRRREAQRVTAHEAAVQALIALHPTQFEALVDHELAKLTADQVAQ